MAPSSRSRRPAKADDATLSTLVTLCSTESPQSWSANVVDAAHAVGCPTSARAAIHRIVRQAVLHVTTNHHCLDVAHTLLTLLGTDVDTQLLRYSIARALLSAGRDATDWACLLDDGVGELLGGGADAVPPSLVVGCVMVLALTQQHGRLTRTAPRALACLWCDY